MRERIAAGTLPKGDVLAVARVAGIMAAKRTPRDRAALPPAPLTMVEVDPVLDEPGRARRPPQPRRPRSTGVEMEALTAVAAAALTVYDMTKGLDPTSSIEQVS